MSADLPTAMQAITTRDGQQLLLLLQACPELIEAATEETYSDTLLHFAAKENDVDAVKLLLDMGADLHRRTYATPLHAAAGYPAVEAVEILIAAGAEVNRSPEDEDESPLGYAIVHGCREVADLLLRHGARIETLWDAAGAGDVDRVKTYLDRDGDPTPDAFCFRVNFLNYGDFEIPNQPNLSDPSFLIEEAFMYACSNSRIEAADHLLSVGVDINAEPYLGTGLHHAAYRGRRAMVEFLVSRGADLDLRDAQYAGPPAGWAREGGHSDIETFLRGMMEGG